ncbi:phytoene/squalene synthase family protein [Polycladidibacter stylochi]|uniref:phytoene/squalene synthase family protein n=1 Tax=Polycladidibacter stylochi TaxID=1807766 RepID=UPI000835E78B|nr:squalene/phytoene synthase family protein [Pseudovibrio stylochi]
MEEATRYCADLLKQHDWDRYAATLMAPQAMQPPLFALYAFNCEIARIRSFVQEPMPGEIRLQWWVDALQGSGHGDVTANPVAAALLTTIADYRLPLEPLLNLIEARRFDLYNDPMPDLASFEGYCGETCSHLFQLAAMIALKSSRLSLEDAPALADLCGHAGVAYAGCGLLKALPYTNSRSQLFIPQSLLQQHQVNQSELFANRFSPQVDALLQVMIGIITKHDALAREAARLAPKQIYPVFAGLGLVKHQLKNWKKGSPFSIGENRILPKAEPSKLRRLLLLYRGASLK